MRVEVRSPYSNDSLPWLKGNLHTHTGNSDGPRQPQCTVNDYAARGYDFLMLSDHDRLTDPETLDARGLTLVPGNEITADGPHLLHVDARSVIAPDADRQTVLDAIAAEGGLAVMCHPNWEKEFAHCPHGVLE
ncbi:MAG: phosphoesterase, partial [Nitrospiraceae bacterium]|nr:phosphoesterase [Nitrospiraceae bacterium]